MENSHIFKDEKEIYSIIGKNVRYYRKLYSLTKKRDDSRNTRRIC